MHYGYRCFDLYASLHSLFPLCCFYVWHVYVFCVLEQIFFMRLLLSSQQGHPGKRDPLSQ